MQNTLHLDTKTFRLGLYAGDYTQPISLLRDLGPFSGMAREDRRLQLVFPPRDEKGGQQIGWNWLIQCDAIFMSHPLGDLQINVIATATLMGIPVWIEFVDDLFAIGKNHPSYRDLFSNKKQMRENVRLALEMATVTTVVSDFCREAFVRNCFPELAGSTGGPPVDSRGARESLEERVSGEPPETASGPDALPNPADKILVIPEGCMWPAQDSPRRKVVSWRGLSTHDEDVASAVEQVCAVAKDFPDWEWVLFGAPSEEFVEKLTAAAGERVQVSPYWPTPFHQQRAWAGTVPYLHLVPLADNEFNRSKSHLAWLEATAIGAGVIAPKHLPEWRQPGVIGYDGGPLVHEGKEDFGTVLRREMLKFDEGKLHPGVELARAAIYPQRTMRAMNQRRWAILRKLTPRAQEVAA